MLKISRLAASVLLAATLMAGVSAGTAFAATETFTSSYKTWNVDPTYRSYNTGAYTLMGYYFCDVDSGMHITNTSRTVQSGAISSQAMLSIGRNGTLYSDAGPVVTNTSSNSVLNYIRSNHYYSLSTLRGESGAIAWGRGQVRSADLTMNNVTSAQFSMVTLDASGHWTGLSTGNDFEIMSAGFAGWPEGNFVDSDGLVYGVPYTDEDGNLVEPDMLRVMLDDESFGYVSLAEMDAMVFEGAATQEELDAVVARIEEAAANAYKNAFAQYYGIDVLSFDDALNCVSDLKTYGADMARERVENSTSAALAEGVKSGVVSEGRGSELTADSTVSFAAPSISISEDAFCEIQSLAAPMMSISVPVYSDNGTVIGQYPVCRL